MPFPAGLRALNHRDFRIFWTGQGISLLGTWMQSVGQSWLVLELPNSAFLLGVIGALQFAPILFFSVFAGAVVDRLPFAGVSPIGALFVGSIAQAFGTLAAYAAGGGLGLLGVLVLRAHRKYRAQARE